MDLYTQQLALKQQAVMRLDAEMKRLVILFDDQDLFAEKASHADSNDGVEHWLYRAQPNGVIRQVGAPDCFVLTYNAVRQI